MNNIIIETNRLFLQKLTEEDNIPLLELFSDSVAMKYFPSTKNIEQVNEWIRTNVESYNSNGYGLYAPPALIAACQRAGVSLLCAVASSEQVVQELMYYLSRSAARRSSLHGVFIEVMGVGVLLIGKPGVGKSELALELLTRGHRLIADDAPEFTRVTPDSVEGSCPPALRDFMEVRGLGIINVRKLFGDSAVKPRRTLRLVINLVVLEEDHYSPEERLQGIRGEREVLGLPLSEVSLPVAPGHNMAVLVECTVRNFILSMKGYDAAEDFADRQTAIMRGEDIAED